MECACKVLNGSGQVITKLVVAHASGTLAPGKWSKVIGAEGIPVGGATAMEVAHQEVATDDWWSVGIVVNNKFYILSGAANDENWAEAEVPANGSVQFVIGAAKSDGSFPLDIETFKKSDYTDSDGKVSKQLSVYIANPGPNPFAGIGFPLAAGD